MTCSDFEKKVYLYLSGELNHSEKNVFKLHLKSCTTCQKVFKNVNDTWSAMIHLPVEKPSRETRKMIIEQAKEKKVRPSLPNRLSQWIEAWILPKKWLWGISTVAVALLLIFIITNPFDHRESDQPVQTQILDWEDDFFSQAEWINSEIDRMESGQFVTTYTFIEDEPPDFQETLSPLSEDLNWIREQMENLITTIYGI